jgi:UDP-galactopyranose mutase
MRDTRTTRNIVCFSHLRWNFVFQRPQHLLTRAAKEHHVYYIEEPIGADASSLQIANDPSGVTVITPHIRECQDVRDILDDFLLELEGEIVTWFYTPMALPLASSLTPSITVFDCMDELSAFKFASPELKRAERKLIDQADIIFTGGQSLYEAKKPMHANVHCFPSSVDAQHFAKAKRLNVEDPTDQKHIKGPRFGFFGVIDERFDIELLGALADIRPEWSFIMIGPVVKIDPETLPRRDNIHWLGGRDYKYLPQYLAHWDCGIMPFAMNEATRFISPTKTPEFLAAGLPVVSTPIRDVVRPYGEKGLVEIASTATAFAEACAKATHNVDDNWRAKVDDFLSSMSWDATWAAMKKEIEACTVGEVRPVPVVPALAAREVRNARI